MTYPITNTLCLCLSSAMLTKLLNTNSTTVHRLIGVSRRRRDVQMETYRSLSYESG